jgi:hypothetical protein
LFAGLARRDAGLLALAGDLCVPPLALLVSIQLLLAIATLAPWILGAPWFSSGTVVLAGAGLAATLLAVSVAWARFARAHIPGWVLLVAPLYLAWKLPLYVVLILKGKQRTWERTARPGEKEDSAPRQR